MVNNKESQNEQGTILLQASVNNTEWDEPVETKTVYFDGSCALCYLEVKHYASLAKEDQLTFVDVSRKNLDLGPCLTSEDAMRRFHVRLADGTLISGANAFVAIWRVLPGWRWIGKVGQTRAAILVLEGAYRLFLPFRPKISKLVAYLGYKAESR